MDLALPDIRVIREQFHATGNVPDLKPVCRTYQLTPYAVCGLMRLEDFKEDLKRGCTFED